MKELVFIRLGVLLVVSILQFKSEAQNTFEKRYGTGQYEEFWGAAVLSDTSIVQAGYTVTDAYLIKTNRFGDTLWTKEVVDSGVDLLYSVRETPDKCIIAAGRSSSYGAGGMDMYLIKLSQTGQVLWRKAIGSPGHEIANDITVCADGGFLLTGYTKLPNGIKNDVYIVKTDSLGAILWTKALSGNGDSNGYSVTELSNHDIVVAGLIVNGSVDALLYKLDNSGNIKWMRSYGSGGDDRAHSVVEGNNGEIIVAGLCQTNKVLLFKTDSMGAVLWSKSYGNPVRTQVAYSLNKTSDSGFILCGYQGTSQGDDYLLIKTNSNGDTSWTRNYGFSSNDYAQKAVEFPGGGFLITGYSQKADSMGNFDLYSVKTDSLGYTSCSQRNAIIQVNNVNLAISIITLTASSIGVGVSAPFTVISTGTTEVICEQCAIPSQPVDITPFGNKIICQNNSTNLSATSTGSVKWYTSLSSTLAIATGTSYATPPLTPGTFTYYTEAFTCTPSISRTAITVTVSVCTGIEHSSSFTNLTASIYPNPFNTSAIFEFNTPLINAEMQLFNIAGQQLKKLFFSGNTLTLHKGDLNPGIYYYKILNEKRVALSGKLVVGTD